MLQVERSSVNDVKDFGFFCLCFLRSKLCCSKHGVVILISCLVLCACVRACLPCLYNWFLFSCSLDSAFLSGVSVSPTCYFEPPTPSCPTLSFWGLPVLQRDSVHNPRCPIQQHPSSTFLPHQPTFTFPLTNMELFLFKCLCLSYLIMLFWFLPFFFFLFQFAFFFVLVFVFN